MHIWNELTQTAGHQLGYANMVGNVPSLTKLQAPSGSTATVAEEVLYIPLQFWFNRNPGLALPLIALISPGQNSICNKECSPKNEYTHQLFQPQMLVAY